MDKRKPLKGGFLVLLGGALWGTMGVAGHPLFESDLPTLQIVSMRTSLAAVSILLIMFLTKPSLLKIRPKHIPFFMLCGFLAQYVFGFGYYSSIRMSGATAAVILLYTAPIFVSIYSRIFFRELFTWEKILGLVLTLTGCFLTVGGLNLAHYDVNPLGIPFGLLAGFAFASYTIMGKIGLTNYSPLTVATYSLTFGAVFLFITHPPVAIAGQMTPLMWVSLLGLGLVSTTFAYICYTFGLQLIESSRASIIASSEVVSAAVLAYFVLQEPMDLPRLIGIALVLSGVVTTQEHFKLGGRPGAQTSDSYEESTELE